MQKQDEESWGGQQRPMLVLAKSQRNKDSTINLTAIIVQVFHED
jgi:hypothetical protein